MRDDAKNYILVGTFVMAMVAALIIWIALVSGRTGPVDHYRVVYDNVLGLKSGVEILFEGYPVGFIESISPVDRDGQRRYELEVSVKEGWPVPADSIASIRSPGLLAAFVIDIRGGESNALLPPGSEIPSAAAGDILETMNKLAAGVDGILEESVRPLLDTIAEGVPSVLSSVEEITTELKHSTKNINRLLGDTNVARVSSILQNLESTSGNANQLVVSLSDTRARLDEVIGKVDVIMERESGELQKAIAELNYSLAAVSRHIDAITANLETTTRNASEFSRQIRENPSVVLRGREQADEE
ncbi:MAG: MCE family protein [Deltaproteobacteria bacterium]|nr:MCE family protein [Deltaproteobacteria bacterium]MBW2417500.1 MCE family protein [Deltaproteobacteria bacterium]